jgi:DNA-binding beta-propeller fold protein YncE
MTIDTASGRLLRTAPTGVIPGAIAADDPDGRVFVAGMDERTFPRDDTPELTILNTRGEVVKASTPFSPCPCAGSAMSLPSIAVDSAVHRVYVVLLESIVTFDATTGAPLGVVAANVFGAEGTPAYAIDTVHHRVFAATGTGVAVIDGRTGVLIRTIRLGDSERALAVDGQTDRLFVAENAGCPSGRPSSARGGVAVFDGSTGQPITHVLRSCVSPMILMDQPARRLLVQLPNGYSRWIKYGVLDTATGRLLRTITMATGPGVFAAVEPGTGRIYYVAGGAVRVLDPRDWKLGRKIILPPGTVGAVTIAVRLHRLLVTDPSHGTVTILPAAPPPAG